MPAKILDSVEQRIAASSARVGECLVWQRPPTKAGYGLIWIDGRHVQVHRAAYAAHYGDIPPGKLVMHSCDNRLCVEPTHLSLGSHLENTADMDSKGRARKVRGDDHPNSKLTSTQVATIKRRYKAKCRVNGGAALAREFGVKRTTIQAIMSLRSWKNA